MTNRASRILTVERDAAFSSLLAQAGWEVERADNLGAGIEKISTRMFGLILLELSLPENGGWEAFNRLRAAAPETPLVVVAEPADEVMASEMLRLGAQDYLLKPQVTGSVLARTVQKTIDRHRGQMAHGAEGVLLRTLMDNIPDAIYFKDQRSRFLMISRAHAKLFELNDPAQAVGKTDADFFAAPHAQQALNDEQQIMRTGQPIVGVEEAETWPGGGVTWASTTKMPLRDQDGNIVGTFGISRDITKRKLIEQALVQRTLQLQKKNQQIEEELKMARQLQFAMLPQKFPSVPHGELPRNSALKFFSFFSPSGTVSGDFFDVIPLSPTSVGVFICDVMGHDVRAALVTAMLRALVEDLSVSASEPGHLLAEINRDLVGVFRQTGATMFATAFYLVADIATGELTYASAAHPSPLHLHRPQGKVEPLGNGNGHVRRKGPALGLFPDAQFPSNRRALAADDVIVLFTDGMIEAEGQNEEIFSAERLASAVAKRAGLPTKKLLAGLVSEIRQFSGRRQFMDDVCLVGMEVNRLLKADPNKLFN